MKHSKRLRQRRLASALAALLCSPLAVAFAPMTQSADAQQQLLDNLAAGTEIKYAILSNVAVDNCQQDTGSGQCYHGQLSIEFPADVALDNWQIYFSNTSNIKWDNSPLFNIQHLNGDIHVISAEAGQNIKKGRYTIEFKGVGSIVGESEVMPNYFMVAEQLQAKVIQSTVPQFDADTQLTYYPHVVPFVSPQQTKRRADDAVPLASPEYLYQHYALINQATAVSAESGSRIIPKAQHTESAAQRISLMTGIALDSALAKPYEAALERLAARQITLNTEGLPLNISINQAELGPQAYQLNISARQISLVAGDDAGAFYGLITLAQLADDEGSVPLGTWQDAPRYDFRGLHVDVARNFHSKAFLLDLIEQMAALKINKLHLHLAEDEAWRLQIPGLPELTEVGGFRCYDPLEQTCLMPQLGSGPERDTPVNGYLSVEDYQQVLRFAAARFIEVIPSLDMPGHSRAAIKSMEARYQRLIQAEKRDQAEQFLLTEFADKSQYRSIQHYSDNTLNPCIDSTYRFVDKVLDELIAMHQQAGVPLKRYHIGADETAGAWKDSPACAALIASNPDLQEASQLGAYFVERVANMVAAKNVLPGAWDDGLHHAHASKLPQLVQANIWGLLPGNGFDRAHDFANQGWDTVLSFPDVLYFDFPYQADPKEPGYYWGSRNTDSFQVFQFMPDNLPVHAEFWTDAMGKPFVSEEKIELDKNVKVRGIQAQLWSETVRSDDWANYMLFPRLIAFAERAWHKPQWAVPYQPGQRYSRDSQQFTQTQQQQMYADWAGFSQVMLHKFWPELAAKQVMFRLPTPGGKISQGMLYANSMYPGIVIEYQLQGQPQWHTYEQPVKVDKAVNLRSTLPSLGRYSRAVSVSANKE